MSEPIPIERWPARLEAAVADCGAFDQVRVLNDTASTQDAARRMHAAPGTVIVAWNQAAGRGRLGRAWASATEGAAVTFVLEPGQTERLAIVGAVAAAGAAEAQLEHAVGIKWPNDIVVGGRKLAGVLVEQNDNRALPAIGMNVAQLSWPSSLGKSAVSLRELGVDVDRLDVLEALIRHMDRAIVLSDEELMEEFSQRDVLGGQRLTLREGGRVITGRLSRLDPLVGLAVETDLGSVWLPAATTTVLKTSIDRVPDGSAASE